MIIAPILLLFSAVIGMISASGKKRKIENSIPVIQSNMNNAYNNLAVVNKNHETGTYIGKTLCENIYLRPEDMRVFVNFFETGRAKNLNEARDLIDEYLHRKNMENYGRKQAQYAFDTREAAYEARAAAERAATNASNASTAASRAEFYARFK